MRHFPRWLAAAAFVLSSNSALARRTVIDQSGSVALSGYCDLNGDDCAPTPLGFTINFGGTNYDSFVLYGNGAITFGNSAISSATILGATSLADYGAPVISSGIDNTSDPYFGGGFLQSGVVLAPTADHHFGGTFSTYLGSSSSKVESQLDIQATENGLLVKIFNYANSDQGFPFGVSPPAPFTEVVPQLAGYSVPGVGGQEIMVSNETAGAAAGPVEFFIKAPVTFGAVSAVPEPSVWLMMIAGLGLIGAALRSRRARSPSPSRSRGNSFLRRRQVTAD